MAVFARGSDRSSRWGAAPRAVAAFFCALLCVLGALQPAAGEGSGPIWTTKPTPVDPAGQDYQRLPATSEPYPLKLRINQMVKVHDSATFEIGKAAYRLAGIDPVDPASICAAEDGSRWPCGVRSRLALRRLVAGRFLDCREAAETPEATMVECRKSGTDIARALVSGGHAFASLDSDYRAEEQTAREAGAGIWRDMTCRIAGSVDADCTLRGR